MNKKMEMINALNSHYAALLDRLALDINKDLEGQDSQSLDVLTNSIKLYSDALNQYNFVQKLKENLIQSEEASVNPPEESTDEG